MEFVPDIVVTSPGDHSAYIVVEAKLRTGGRADLAAPLRHYMIRMRSPVGILVTRDSVRVFRDSFEGDDDKSVKEVGAIPTSRISELREFATGTNTDPIAFEDAVQGWLVHLRNLLVHGRADGVDPVLAAHVMPALAMGEIRAAGPRSIRRAG